MNQKDIYNFERKFGAKVRPSQTKMVSPYRQFPSFDSNINYEAYIQTEVVPAVEITMPQREFSGMLDILDERNESNREWSTFTHLNRMQGEGWIQRSMDINSREYQEAKMREQNPALKTAWEHYQLLLALSK